MDALDPGGYGSFTISHAITIEGQGWSYVAPPNNGNAITINAVSGNVTIRGVSLNGVGATGGTNGIVFNSGGSLAIVDCVIQNFIWNGSGLNTGDGILIQPTAGPVNFTVTNTTASNNGLAGIYYVPSSGVPSTNGVIDHVVATANLHGIAISPTNTTGGSTVVVISNSIASNNSGFGISGSNNALNSLKLSIDNVSVSGNNTGIEATSSTNALLGRSVITGNTTGINNGTSPNTFYTYKNNQINLNGTDFSGTGLNSTLTLQ